MATYENDGHRGLPVNDECVSISCSQRDYDRENDEKQGYVRRGIGMSFMHDGSPCDGDIESLHRLCCYLLTLPLLKGSG